jgi:hypothetical protein
MASGNAHYIFYGYTAAGASVLMVEFRYYNGSYQLRSGLVSDGTVWRNGAWVTIADGPHAIELDWRAASAAGANDGSLTLWIDGLERYTLGGVDNDGKRVDQVRLGPLSGIDTATRGATLFDSFESRRESYIGPLP